MTLTEHYTTVHQLRREGRLPEARQLAERLMEFDPASLQHRRAYAWVLEAELRTLANYALREQFEEHLHQLQALDLGEDEQMLWEQVAWDAARLLFSAGKAQLQEYHWLTGLALQLTQFDYPKPSKVHSVLLKALIQFKAWPELPMFAERWMEAGLQAEDFVAEARSMSLAERVYIAWSKALLGRESTDRESLRQHLLRLEDWERAHPKYAFLPFFRARVLLRLGEREQGLRAYAPFVESHAREFWAWQYLAEFFEESWEDKTACYARALRCKAPEKMMVRVRENFAALLIERERWSAARAEIELLLHTRAAEGWRVPARVRSWVEADWYAAHPAEENTQAVYAGLAARAEIKVESLMPVEAAVIVRVDYARKLLFCTLSAPLRKQVVPLHLWPDARVGQVLRLRMQSGGKRIKQVSEWLGEVPSDLRKPFEGPLRQKPGQAFAFADGVYLSAEVLERERVVPGTRVSGHAVREYNPAKESWGWRAV